MLLLLACVTGPPPPPPSPDPVAPPRPVVHASAALVGRDALVFGDLDGWRVAAGRAAGDDLLPEETRTRWRTAGTSPDFASAIASFGSLAGGCAPCHLERGLRMKAPSTWEVPGDGVRPEMERHAQGLDQLWFGLVAPEPTATEAGLAVLRNSQLFLSRTDAGGAATRMDEAVGTAADEVARATDAPGRGAAFGRLVAACAQCHGTRPDGLVLEPD